MRVYSNTRLEAGGASGYYLQAGTTTGKLYRTVCENKTLHSIDKKLPIADCLKEDEEDSDFKIKVYDPISLFMMDSQYLRTELEGILAVTM